MPAEEWKPIEGYEGYYSVSNLGRVRSEQRVVPHKLKKIKTIPERILKARIEKQTGYYSIKLYKHNEQKTFWVHRLVAKAFLPAIEGKDVVNHIDYCRTNNSVSNLEWCTQSANIQHSHKHNRKTARQKLTVKEVKYIEANAKTGRGKNSGNNIKQLAEMFGVHASCIYNILRGNTWSYI